MQDYILNMHKAKSTRKKCYNVLWRNIKNKKEEEKVRSKRKIVAWLLTLIMVISLMPNQYMFVTHAEETTLTGIEYSVALENATEIKADEEAIAYEQNEQTVQVPYLDGDGNALFTDATGTFYKLTVPENSAVVFKAEYTGELVTGIEGQNQSNIMIYREGESSYGISCYNYDGGSGSPDYMVLENRTETPNTYLVSVPSDIVELELSVQSAVSYDSVEGKLEVGDITIGGEPKLYSYPGTYNAYDSSTGSYYSAEGIAYHYGYMYKLDYSTDKTYAIKLKYIGETVGIDYKYYYSKVLIKSYNPDGLEEGYWYAGVTPSVDSSMNTSYVAQLPAQEAYYILDPCDWSQTSIRIEQVNNISTLKSTDKVNELTNNSTTTVAFANDIYEYISGSAGDGCLCKITLGKNEGCEISTDNQMLSMYAYTEDGLGSSVLSSAYSGQTISLYNSSNVDPASYYIWINNQMGMGSTSVDVTVSDLKFAADMEVSSAISTDGIATPVKDEATNIAVLDNRMSTEYKSTSYKGTLYSVTVSGNSTAVLTFQYVGEKQTGMSSKWANLAIADAESKLMSELYVCDAITEYSDSTTANYSIVNGDSEAKTYYLIAYTGMPSMPEGEFQISAKEVKSITALMDDATNITELDTCSVTVSKESYEYPYSGGSSVGKGTLLKLELDGGDKKNYSITYDDTSCSRVTTIVLRCREDGALFADPYSSGYVENSFYVKNGFEEKITYYIWCFVDDSGPESFTVSKVKNISEITDEKTYIVDHDGTYNISMSAEPYMYSPEASTKGALLKFTLNQGEAYVLEDADGSECFTVSSYAVYDDSCLGYTHIKYEGYPNAVIGNTNSQQKNYYMWLNPVSSSVSITATKINLADKATAENIYANGNSAQPGPADSYVGYIKNFQVDNLNGTEVIDDIDAEKALVYKVSLQPNSSYTFNLEVKNPVEGTDGFTQIPTTTARILYPNLKECGRLEVSKYTNYPNFNTGTTGMLASSSSVTNNEDTAQTYYILVSNVEVKGDVELSVTTMPSVSTLVNEALDISAFDTYTGPMTTAIYNVAGNYHSNGKLVKVELEPNEKIEVLLGANMSATRLVLVDGELIHSSEVLNKLDVLANTEDVTKIYYYWVRSGYEEVDSYEITTRSATIPYLSELSDEATALNKGNNTLYKNQSNIKFLDKEIYWYEDENGNISSNEVTSLAEGTVYKFEIPAMEKATFVFNTGAVTSDITGPDFYENPDERSGYQMGYYVYPDGTCHDQRTYVVSNVSETPKTIFVVMPSYDWVQDEVSFSITTESVIPNLDDDVLYIVSWNDELSTRMELFYKKYPEYKDKIKYVNLDCSGTGEYVDYAKLLAKQLADKTALFAMDIDVLEKLLPEEEFVSLESIGFDVSKYDNAYDYTIDMSTYNEKLKAVAWSAEPGNFAYNTAIAKEIFGTSDPTTVQTYLSDSDKFLETAKLMKEAGYYMTSGEDMLAAVGRYSFNKTEAEALSQAITEGGYSTGNESWSVGWNKDMTSGKVFGFFGCTWFMYWSMMYSDNIDIAVCEGPIAYPWGGSFIGVSSNHTNTENDKLAALVLETLCCDEEFMYENSVDGDVVFPNNQNVVLKLISDGEGRMEQLSNSQNPLLVWHRVAKKIGKGEWESKCTDKKYIINVASDKTIDLANNTELATAGFVYSNFAGLAEENANATFSNGILTVDNPDKVVRYIYIENGISRELQFITCVAAADGSTDNSVKVEEDVVVETDENGEEISKTTTFIEVTNGEISGQVDEISVNTGDAETTIVVTENKDILGDVVEDASITVTQKTISEDALQQSIEVAVQKNESYANANESESEEKVEIKEIKAEFTDDTDSTKTTISTEVIKGLKDNEMSLELTKKKDGKVEYKWNFDKDSMKDVADKDVKPVNTKITIHKDMDDAEKPYHDKEKLNKHTEENSKTSVVAFEHEGELPGKTTVTVNVDGRYEDDKNLYYYHFDKEGDKLDYVGRAKVEKGMVPIKISHCSDYVLTDLAAVSADSIAISTETNISKPVEIGETITFAVDKITPAGAVTDVIWSTSDANIATVENGVVKTVAAGTVNITATVDDGSGISVTKTITVKAPDVKASEVKLSVATDISMKVGETITISSSVLPENTTDKTVVWASSDETVAKVDANGKVTAVGVGTVRITATTADGSGKSASCNIKINSADVKATSVTVDKTEIELTVGHTATVSAIVYPFDSTNKNIIWSSSDKTIAKVNDDGTITALKPGTVTITATAEDGSGAKADIKVVVSDIPGVTVSYRTHIERVGWEPWKKDGAMGGTSGRSLRLEGINIAVASAVEGKEIDLGIQYTTHCESYGWLPWAANGDMSGTEGESKRLEAIEIQLTGADAELYDVYYRVHAESYGWLGWASNGRPAGTAGLSKRLEGIQVLVVKKGESINENVDGISSKRTEAFVAKDGKSPIVNYEPTSNQNPVIPGADTPNVTYRTHVEREGWQSWKYNGQMSGTSGQSKRLEGIEIELSNKDYSGGIAYTTHVERIGWQGDVSNSSTWMKDGAMAGTSGRSLRLEAICIELTGEMAEHYDIYYRVHAEQYGWLGWAKNGEASGTAGCSKRLEGIQIVLVEKGGAAPANTYKGITSKNLKPYIQK